MRGRFRGNTSVNGKRDENVVISCMRPALHHRFAGFTGVFLLMRLGV